jgi:hypothetical protein
MKTKMIIRTALVALAGMVLSGCAAGGTVGLSAGGSAIQPPALYAHRAGTSHVVLYWNCTRPEPGFLRVEGLAQQAGGMQDVGFFEMVLAGADARGHYISEASAALPDISLHTHQVSPIRLDLRTAGTEVRFDLFYRYDYQDLVSSRQDQRFMVRDLCSETQHRVPKPTP